MDLALGWPQGPSIAWCRDWRTVGKVPVGLTLLPVTLFEMQDPGHESLHQEIGIVSGAKFSIFLRSDLESTHSYLKRIGRD